MPGLLDTLLPQTEAPTVTTPTFKVNHSGAGGGDGGALGSVMDAVGLSAGAQDPWANSVYEIVVEQGFAPFIGRASISLNQDQQMPALALADEVTIDLGQNDGATSVFSGAISQIQRRINGEIKVVVTDNSLLLSQKRINQSYEQQSAGAIVSDLANQAGVESNNIEDGIELPFYVIEDRKNLYQHICDLSQRCGFVVFFDSDNKLNFQAVSGSEAELSFNYGHHLLALSGREVKVAYDKVQLTGESAAGSEGTDAAYWLVKDPSAVQQQLGDGDFTKTTSDAALKDSDSVQQAAQAQLQNALLQAFSGRFVVAGNGNLKVGQLVELQDVPQGELNGLCLIKSIRHRYDKISGFVSECFYVKYDGDSGFSLSSLGGLL